MGGWGGGGGAKIQRIRKVNFFYKESKSNIKKILAVGRDRGGGVARVSDFLFFFQKNPSLEKKNLFSF